MPQFDLSTFPGQMLWLAGIFAMQYLIISRVIAPGFKLLFGKRRRHIEQQLKEASALSDKSKALKLDYEQRYDALKKSLAELVEKAYQETDLLIATRLAELERTCSQEIKAREEKSKLDKLNIESDMDEATLDLASSLLYKVTNSKVTRKQLSKYMN
jgi:F-type H+-transporting ATPase subunit b